MRDDRREIHISTCESEKRALMSLSNVKTRTSLWRILQEHLLFIRVVLLEMSAGAEGQGNAYQSILRDIHHFVAKYTKLNTIVWPFFYS